ncbi:MAG: DeoR family transcriptional regulator [Crocinitomix sp.]|nr:DeoR family transcriptional regulator [Crocinitomix sp.]
MKGFDNPDISKKDREGLYFIQQNEPISVKDYAMHFDLTDKTAQRRLANLVNKGLLIKEGDKRWTKYRLKE